MSNSESSRSTFNFAYRCIWYMHYVCDAAKSHSQERYRLSGVRAPLRKKKKNIQPFILDTGTKFRHLSFWKAPGKGQLVQKQMQEKKKTKKKKHATFQKFGFWNQIQWKEMCGLLYFVVTLWVAAFEHAVLCKPTFQAKVKNNGKK